MNNISQNALTVWFEKIYIINLPYRQDRRNEMQAELAKIGLSLEHPQVMLFKAIKPDNAGEWPSVGARGCFMSHLGVLKHAQEAKYKSILILEDDLNFVTEFNVKFSTLLNNIDADNVRWGVFYGGYDLEPEPLPNEKGFQLATPELGIRTTHFIGFDASIFSKLVDHLTAIAERKAGDPNGGPMHVDGAYSWFRKTHPNCVTVMATPQLGYQRSSQTDIYALSWKDRLPVVRGFVRLARRIKNYFRAKRA